MNKKHFTILLLLALSSVSQADYAVVFANTSGSPPIVFYASTDQPTPELATQEALVGCEANAAKNYHASPCYIALSGSGPAHVLVYRDTNTNSMIFGHDLTEQLSMEAIADGCSGMANCKRELSFTDISGLPN